MRTVSEKDGSHRKQKVFADVGTFSKHWFRYGSLEWVYGLGFRVFHCRTFRTFKALGFVGPGTWSFLCWILGICFLSGKRVKEANQISDNAASLESIAMCFRAVFAKAGAKIPFNAVCVDRPRSSDLSLMVCIHPKDLRIVNFFI